MSESNEEKLQRIKAETETLWEVSPNLRWLIEQAEYVKKLELDLKAANQTIQDLQYEER